MAKGKHIPHSIHNDPRLREIVVYARDHGMELEKLKEIYRLHVHALREELKRYRSPDIINKFFVSLAKEVKYQCWVNSDKTKEN